MSGVGHHNSSRYPSVRSLHERAFGSSIPTNPANRSRYATNYEAFGDEQNQPIARRFQITPEYFKAFGIPILGGRLFDHRDTTDGLPVAIVNRGFADREWPGESPIGKQLRFEGNEEKAWRTVVGIVPHQLIHRLDEDADPAGVYIPSSQSPRRWMTLALIGRGDIASLGNAMRQEVSRLDADETIFQVATMQEVIDRNTFQSRIVSTMFSAFAGAALLLTAIGLYGVMAFAVGQRTQEIGVRMAFGARRTQVLRLVLQQGLRQTALGLGIGLALAFFFARLLANVLYKVNPTEPTSYIMTAVVLATVAIAACAIPARRAAALDPVEALRQS